MNIPDDLDEAKRKRDNIANLLREFDKEERRKAEAAAEEAARQKQARENAKGLTVEELRQFQNDLDRHIQERETHVRWEAERETLQRRADRIAAEIAHEEARLAEKREQLAQLTESLDSPR